MPLPLLVTKYSDSKVMHCAAREVRNVQVKGFPPSFPSDFQHREQSTGLSANFKMYYPQIGTLDRRFSTCHVGYVPTNLTWDHSFKTKEKEENSKPSEECVEVTALL